MADLDLDGQQEVVAGRTAYRTNGTVLWDTGTSDGFNAIGNFDNDRFPEVVLVTQGTVRLLEHDGSVKWGPIAIPGGGRGGAPTVADFDNDGRPEIGVAGRSRYVTFDTDGSILWQTETQDGSSHVTGSSVFDFDGDGTAEVVYGDEEFVRIYRGVDGETLYSFERSSPTSHELPVVADVDGDGQTEVVFGASFDSRFPTDGLVSGLAVIGSTGWVPTRPVWNQHSYHITNINDDGSIPVVEPNSWEIYNNYRRNLQPTGTQLGRPTITATAAKSQVPAGTSLVISGRATGGQSTANATASTIDFESIPEALPSDGLIISDQFLDSHGVTFSLEGGGHPVLAQVGPPATAFLGPPGHSVPDSPADGVDLGAFFLTDDGNVGAPPSPLIVTYDRPVAQASGEIIDIDFSESWLINARIHI